MRVIKKINNNVAVCIDDRGLQLIALGRGIGFPPMPYDLTDMLKIDRTFYDVDNRLINGIIDLPEDLIKFSIQVVDAAERQTGKKMNPNLPFTLADHFHYTVKRIKQGIVFQYNAMDEIGFQHPQEMKLSKAVVAKLEKIYQVNFPRSEAAIITMHLVEAENYTGEVRTLLNHDYIITQVMEIIREQLTYVTDDSDFNYVRFVTHLNYLLDRVEQGKQIDSDNKKMYEEVASEYLEIYACVQEIQKFLEGQLHSQIKDEELLYLMLHINRLVSGRGL